jgi:hypothetical protein
MMKERRVRIVMDEAFWQMLEKTECVIKARAKKKGLPPATQRRLLGAILSDFFLRHHEALLSEHHDVAIETTREYLGKYFSPSELAALGGSVVSEVQRHGAPEDVRGGRTSDAEDE